MAIKFLTRAKHKEAHPFLHKRMNMPAGEGWQPSASDKSTPPNAGSGVQTPKYTPPVIPELFINWPETKLLYHVTTPKKAKKYRESGCILKPVRGFTTLSAAMAWAIKTGRTVIYAVEGSKLKCYKLPDHHNEYGQAWWFDENIKIDNIKCVFSAEKDA